MAQLEQAKLSKPLCVWLKIDTGMHRLGFQPYQVKSAYQRLISNAMVQKPLKKMRVGTAAIGYGHGYPRNAVYYQFYKHKYMPTPAAAAPIATNDNLG